MKCINCGNEIADNSAFCAFCGSPTSPVEETQTTVSAVHQKLLDIFKDKLFLVLCILVSASTVISIASSNVPLLLILFTIFLWLIYAKAAKNTVDIKNMRNVSGTIFATYVIGWVTIGLLGLVSVMGAVVALAIGNTAELQGIITKVLSEIDYSFNEFDTILELATGSIMIITAVVLIIVFIACIIAAVINIFGMRSIHKFAKSLYKSAEIDNFCIEKLAAAKSWILVFGILSCVSCLFSIGSFKLFLSNGCLGAAYILAYVLIREHFFKPQQIN